MAIRSSTKIDNAYRTWRLVMPPLPAQTAPAIQSPVDTPGSPPASTLRHPNHFADQFAHPDPQVALASTAKTWPLAAAVFGIAIVSWLGNTWWVSAEGGGSPQYELSSLMMLAPLLYHLRKS